VNFNDVVELCVHFRAARGRICKHHLVLQSRSDRGFGGVFTSVEIVRLVLLLAVNLAVGEARQRAVGREHFVEFFLEFEQVSSIGLRTSASFGYSASWNLMVRWNRCPFNHSEKRTSQA